MIDREQVAEALAQGYGVGTITKFIDGEPMRGFDMEQLAVVFDAARAWLDQGDALVIRKDENGEWPEWALKLVDHMNGRYRAWQILDALSL